MSLREMDTQELMAIVNASKTDDGRVAPDYADSFELSRVIDELASRATAWENCGNC